ncbi:MAG: lysoplasmalogenase [Ilumatobacteraceae bacterium]
MNGSATILLVTALVIAVLDWWAVARRIPLLEYFCKPAAAVAFLLCAGALDPAVPEARTWLVVALVFCVVGDIFLMVPRDAFLAGLGSFAVAQIIFCISFAVREPTATRAVVGLLVVSIGTSILARRFVGALRRSGARSMVPPVLAYVAVISAMVASAIAGGTAVAIVGAVLFMISDSLIAEERFVRSRRWQRLAIIVSYHLALAGLVLGLV